MLIAYRKDYQKIAMGLLSLLPPFKDYHRLKAVIDWSGESDQLIYLWQNETIGQFTGIVVVSVGQDYVLVRHLSFTPSDRAGKNVFALLAALQERYPQKRIMGTLTTQGVVTNWARDRYYRQGGDLNG
ncbi:reductase [Limosilactobacillus fermentum]